MKESLPFISIIIPVLNEEKYIEDVLNSINSSTYPKDKIEVFLIDGGSTDNTLEIIEIYKEKYSWVKVLKNPKKIVPVALNIGIKHSTGKFIVRLDAHADYPAEYLEYLIVESIKLNADNVGVACETQTKGKSLIAKGIKACMTDRLGGGASDFRSGVDVVKEVDTVPFGCFKADVFQRCGLFNEQLVRVQDLEFNKRLKRSGGKIYILPNLKCTYYSRTSLKDHLKNRSLTGYWVLKTARLTRRLSSVSIRHLIPSIFVLIIIVSLVIGIFKSEFIILALIISFLHYIVLLLYSTKKYGIRNAFIYSIVFMSTHYAYGIGTLKSLIL